MKYLLIPIAGQSVTESGSSEWTATAEVTLGGVFYDYICTTDGAVAGVRYWIEPGTDFDRHPVFSFFLEDERFHFKSHDGYVDLIFDGKYVDALRTGALKIQTVQDFGGESVVKNGGLLGIAFDL